MTPNPSHFALRILSNTEPNPNSSSTQHIHHLDWGTGPKSDLVGTIGNLSSHNVLKIPLVIRRPWLSRKHYPHGNHRAKGREQRFPPGFSCLRALCVCWVCRTHKNRNWQRQSLALGHRVAWHTWHAIICHIQYFYPITKKTHLTFKIFIKQSRLKHS